VPFALGTFAAAIKRRVKAGTNFSIVAVAEGARSVEDAKALAAAELRIEHAGDRTAKEAARAEVELLEVQHVGNTLRLAHQLEQLTGLESRVSILGYVQRGGTPSPVDRLLATRVGSAAADLVQDGVFGVMVAARGDGTEPVPLGDVAGKRHTVPADHPWLAAARHVGTCLGDPV
jgi:6-phosphofructokinase 1